MTPEDAPKRPRSERSGGQRPERSGGQRPERGGTGRPARAGTQRPSRQDDRRPQRDESRPQPEAPEIPELIQFEDLAPEARASLRTLSKENAKDVGRHLVMVGLLLDEDPELAYRHAQVAVSRGGRVDVVREAAAIAAYRTNRYPEALRELRTVRRLNGSAEHLALEADCERGMGRPERAIAIAQSPEARTLSPLASVELDIVVAGARVDMGDPHAALLLLQRIQAPTDESKARVAEAMVGVLRHLGRDADADALEATLPAWDDDEGAEEEIVVYETAQEERTERPRFPEESEESDSSEGSPKPVESEAVPTHDPTSPPDDQGRTP